jgi:hypothetical protein
VKEYFGGYYCRDPLFLQVINKTSNRKILQALRDAYPLGLDIDELGKKAKLPPQTVYAQKTELYREYYIDHYIESEPTKRGRPKSRLRDQTAKKRERVKYVIEETSGVHDPYKGRKLIPLPPGNFVYSEGFVDVWDKLVDKEEEEELCATLFHFVQKMLTRIHSHEDQKVRKWSPNRSAQHCCSVCGLNHEARDFIRAVLLRLIDQFEKNDNLITHLKDNELLKQESFERIMKEKK